jgi:hypothetical protein
MLPVRADKDSAYRMPRCGGRTDTDGEDEVVHGVDVSISCAGSQNGLPLEPIPSRLMGECGRSLPYHLMTFEKRDQVDAERTDAIRRTVSSLPARPGTRR